MSVIPMFNRIFFIQHLGYAIIQLPEALFSLCGAMKKLNTNETPFNSQK